MSLGHRNARLEEAQAGIKIAGRNINHLRYADNTNFMAESEEELKSLLMKVKEESEKVGFKLNIQKMKIMASGPITSWEIDGETVETVSDLFWNLVKYILTDYLNFSFRIESLKKYIQQVRRQTKFIQFLACKRYVLMNFIF